MSQKVRVRARERPFTLPRAPAPQRQALSRGGSAVARRAHNPQRPSPQRPATSTVKPSTKPSVSFVVRGSAPWVFRRMTVQTASRALPARRRVVDYEAAARAASQREELPRSNPRRASASNPAMKSAGTTAVSEVFINSRMKVLSCKVLRFWKVRKAAISDARVEDDPHSSRDDLLATTESLTYRHGGRASLFSTSCNRPRLGGSHRAPFRGSTLGDRHGHEPHGLPCRRMRTR